jgi:hypothetical protein
LKTIIHIIIVSILTLLTQIGGIVWILNFGIFRLSKYKVSKWTRLGAFLVLYTTTTFYVIPQLAKLGGRVALPVFKSGNLMPHNFITPLLNRHYVKPPLKSQLIDIADDLNADNNQLKLSYLDANFPFIDGFPLLPHLSHKDGRKVDLSLFYTKDKIEGNLKPSNSGYGKFVEPTTSEQKQTNECKSKGYWYYDYSKYLTFGSRDDLEFDLENTKQLVNYIIQDSITQKVFIEPHLKRRMNLTNPKIKFQGCHSVRHDDHIHCQIK